MKHRKAILTKAFQFLCLAALATAAATLRADSITYDFSGNLLTSVQGGGVNDPNNNWGGVFHNGESFTGTVTYNTSMFSDGGNPRIMKTT
jgi:hypothetical protein